MNLPRSLINAVATHQLVPFVGAGVSMSLKKGLFPSWPQLLDRLATRLENEGDSDAAILVRTQVKKKRLDRAAEEATEALGNSVFREEMKAAFGIKKPAASDIDLSLPKAIWSLKPKLIVTTNYDRVLEWGGDSDPVTNSQVGNVAELFTKSTVGPPKVWHLHGHVQNLDDAILAPQEYRQLYEDASDVDHPQAAAYQQIRTLFINHPLLFIGFGFQDDNVMDALKQMLTAFRKNLQPSYALLKKDSAPASLWSDFGIKVLEFEDFGQPLLEMVNAIASAAETRRSNPVSVPGATIEVPPIPSSYIEWLTEQCADVTPFGVIPTKNQSVSLQQVYVPPIILKREIPLDGNLGSEATAEAELVVSKSRHGRDRSAEQRQLLLERIAESSLYVSGNPGSGKSTFCKWLSMIVALGEIPRFAVPAPDLFQEVLSDSLKGLLPVCIPLRSLEQHLAGNPGQHEMTASQILQSLRLWMDAAQPGGLTWKVVEQRLKAGKTLLILDGVDELAASKGADASAWSPRNCVLSGIAELAPIWNKQGNRVLITSRPYGLDSKQVRLLDRRELPEVRLEGLPEELQRLLATRWFVALPKYGKDGVEQTEAMLKEIAAVPGVDVLASSPLLLTAICMIYGNGGQLPKDIHQLYDRIVNTTLLSRYSKHQGLIDTVRARLSEVAYGMHSGEPTEPNRSIPVAQVSITELEKILAVYIQASPSTETGTRSTVNTRDDLLSYSGLLGQQSDDRVAFFHLSFQEFLAAERCGRKLDGVSQFVELIARRSEVPNWRPTLRFLLARRIAEKGIEDGGLPLLEKLLQRILPSTVAQSIGLALVIADGLEMLLDRNTRLQNNVAEPMQQICLAAIKQEIEVKARCELAVLLGRIGDSRVSSTIRSDAAFVTVPADDYVYGEDNQRIRVDKPFQISKYVVTNEQFAEFVNSRYSDEGLWHPVGWAWRMSEGFSSPRYWLDKKWNAPNLPVVGVSWWEADAFCRWAGVRLPTEHEWEVAARGPEGFKYPWGNTWQEGFCNSDEAGLNRTSPVGMFTKSASFCGAHDMAGNVWEWCSDHYDPAEQKDDHAGRVLRGGSWVNPAGDCRSSFRIANHPDDRFNDFGFRVARTL